MKPIEDFDLDAILARYKENDAEFDEKEDGVKLIEEGEWESGYKDYANRIDTYQHIASRRFFDIAQSRAGSYYSHYEYNAPEVYEVYPHVVTRTVYSAKKPKDVA